LCVSSWCQRFNRRSMSGVWWILVHPSLHWLVIYHWTSCPVLAYRPGVL
jgi:hypothetical protein